MLSLLELITPEHWLILGLVLLILELITGTTYLLWPAAAAALVGVAAYMGLPPLAALAAFALLVLVLTYYGRPMAQRIMNKDAPVLNERASSMIGQRCTAAGDFVNGHGEVKINDSIWRASCDEPVARGDTLEIVAADGMMLQVKRVA